MFGLMTEREHDRIICIWHQDLARKMRQIAELEKERNAARKEAEELRAERDALQRQRDGAKYCLEDWMDKAVAAQAEVERLSIRVHELEEFIRDTHNGLNNDLQPITSAVDTFAENARAECQRILCKDATPPAPEDAPTIAPLPWDEEGRRATLPGGRVYGISGNEWNGEDWNVGYKNPGSDWIHLCGGPATPTPEAARAAALKHAVEAGLWGLLRWERKESNEYAGKYSYKAGEYDVYDKAPDCFEGTAAFCYRGTRIFDERIFPSAPAAMTACELDALRRKGEVKERICHDCDKVESDCLCSGASIYEDTPAPDFVDGKWEVQKGDEVRVYEVKYEDGNGYGIFVDGTVLTWGWCTREGAERACAEHAWADGFRWLGWRDEQGYTISSVKDGTYSLEIVDFDVEAAFHPGRHGVEVVPINGTPFSTTIAAKAACAAHYYGEKS